MFNKLIYQQFLLNRKCDLSFKIGNINWFSTDSGSSSKKYTSSFKIRAKLAEFFKHIHPDQMNQAPTKIKQENMRSLKNFNQYIDAINQEKSIEGKLLKFYIAEKMNHKSKKFYSFNLELPNVDAIKMNEEKSQRLLEDIVNALNHKFKESQHGDVEKGKKKGKFKNQFSSQIDQNSVKIQTKEERIQREQQTIQSFDQHRRFKDQRVVERLQKSINSKFIQSEKENLEMKLRSNISFADTASSKPMMWARMTADQSGLYKDYQKILNSLIDPKLIYFDERLNEKQIQQFKKKLLPGSLDPLTLKNNDFVNDVCEQMESFHPPVCFYVSNHYSGNQIPGFFTVPYNFKQKQLKQKFDELKGQIQTQQQTYIQYFDYYKDLEKQLKQQNHITIKLNQFKGNNDISEKILMLKRLSKYKINILTDTFSNKLNLVFYPMTEQQFQITLKHYLLQSNQASNNSNKFKYEQLIDKQTGKLKTVALMKINGKDKIFHLINFKDVEMEQAIDRINFQIQELNAVNQQTSQTEKMAQL